MSKLCTKDKTKHNRKIKSLATNKDKTKYKQIHIGSSNVKLWNQIKRICKFQSDSDFTSFLLKLAQKHVDETQKNDDETEPDESNSKETCKAKKETTKKAISSKKSSKNKKDKSEIKIEDKIDDNIVENIDIVSKIDYSLPMVIVEKLDENLFINNNNNNNSNANENLDDINLIKDENVINQSTNNVENIVLDSNDKIEHVNVKVKKPKLELSLDEKHFKKEKSKRKIKNHDIRRAPELEIKPEITLTEPEPSPDDQKERLSIKIKLCTTCNMRHLQDVCPLKNPTCTITDSLTHQQWDESFRLSSLDKHSTDMNIDNNSHLDMDLNLSMDSNNTNDKLDKNDLNSFAIKSLPSMFYLDEIEANHGLSVFTKCEIKEFTQLGPLIGNPIKEVDISEDFCMKYLWEIYAEKNIYISTEDTNASNWLRYIRPAPSREQRNLAVLSQKDQLYMVTTCNIISGEELLYWQDDALGTNKKKMEKTNCGGCNLSFTHPLYYRMHCSVFHDIRYSLTIRKYHCKVCGLPVLGKDNIMKHAVEMHNGQGAYQCQFCKKFFLRLNYLEMHRTYGCAANPHRSRPLCDFCGRKFCQPQKLKVHIKRMHSDMTEVLREFQCKSCMKLLGSRAALQRHVKEVHQKQVEGSLTCLRCGKLFQNKSNLKIHMLTHSGVKPFKCKEENCNAAFTTKQCLQFHYKKVHGFTEDAMPKIERSVEYTFEAYAGVHDTEFIQKGKTKEEQIDQNLMILDESSDVDDISLDEKNLDDPPALDSPMPLTNESTNSTNQTPPILTAYNQNQKSKVVSKGSKKWLGEEINLQSNTENLILDVDEAQNFTDKSRMNLNLNLYNRHESSNASLLVEAALDSVSDIQITPNENLESSQNVTESLVNNLYSLSHQDNLPDVPYNNNEDLNEISPTVNDHISVTDHDLPNTYTLHQNEFTPPNTPRNQLIHDYNIQNSPSNTRRSLEYLESNNSSPRYDFNNQTAPTENLSSDESNNDIVAQNLSLAKNLTYKHYENLESTDLRKYDMRKYFEQSEQIRNKFVDLVDTDTEIKMSSKFDLIDNDFRTNLLRSKELEIDDDRFDNDLRKNYDLSESLDRNKTFELPDSLSNRKYDLSDTLEIRNKVYESTENLDARNKNFDLESLTRKNYEFGGMERNSDSLDARNKSFDLETLSTGRKYESDTEIRKYDLNLDTRKNFDLSENLDTRKTFELDSINRKYDNDSLDTTIRGGLVGNEMRKAFDSSESVDARNKNFELDSLGRKSYEVSVESLEIRSKGYDLNLERKSNFDSVSENLELRIAKNYDIDIDFNGRDTRNFEPLMLNSTELQGLDMSARSYHNFHASSGINRYHHIYGELERSSVDLRLGYSPPPPPYSHADVLRVVSLDLTPPGRHSVDLSLRSHSLHSQLQNSRLLEHGLSTNRILSDHNRLALTEHNLSTNRLLGTDRLLSDHTTNRILSNESSTNRVISDDNRLLSEPSRLLDQRSLLTENRILNTNTPSLDLVARGGLSPGYSGYSVSPSSYHASSLARSHGNSPGHTASASYHHYSTYY